MPVSQVAVYHGHLTLHAVNRAAWKMTRTYSNLFCAPNKVTLNKDDTAAIMRILSTNHLPVIYPGPGSSPSSLLSFPGAPFPSPISITWLFNPCDAIGQFVRNTFKAVCLVSSIHFLIQSFSISFATGFLCSTPVFNLSCCAMDIQDWKLNYFLWSSVTLAVSYGSFSPLLYVSCCFIQNSSQFTSHSLQRNYYFFKNKITCLLHLLVQLYLLSTIRFNFNIYLQWDSINKLQKIAKPRKLTPDFP